MIKKIEDINLENRSLIFETEPIFTHKELYPSLCLKIDNEFVPCFDYDKNWILPKEWIIAEYNNIEDFIFSKLDMVKNFKDLNIIEKSNFISLLIGIEKFNDEKITKEVFPLLSIKKGIKNLTLLRKIYNSSKNIKKSIIKHNFNFQLTSLLFDFDENDINSLILIFDNIPLSSSGKRNILEYTYDIKKINNYSISDILEKIDFHIISAIENKPEAAKKLVEKINLLKFPNLSIMEKKYLELKGHLKFEKGVFILKPEYFEDENYEIKIRFKNIEELQKRVKNIKEISENPYMDKILKLMNN
jgi:hypothetical protein